MISFTSQLADNVSSKVRQLDLAKVSIPTCHGSDVRYYENLYLLTGSIFNSMPVLYYIFGDRIKALFYHNLFACCRIFILGVSTASGLCVELTTPLAYSDLTAISWVVSDTLLQSLSDRCPHLTNISYLLSSVLALYPTSA